MPTELPWLEGRRLVGVSTHDYTWSFAFTDGASISTESVWRLVTSAGVRVTSEDHGQQFGLPEPVDAAVRVLAVTEGKRVHRCRIAERTSDLIVSLEDAVALEFLTLSSGFESWQARHATESIVCMGGGELAFFSNEKKG